MDVFISFLLKNTHTNPGEYEVWNDIYDANIDCDLAIYGSSRAWVQIDPKIMKDTLNLISYNFGIDGHNFWLQYLRHSEFLKNNSAPKSILIAVDVFSLDKRPDLYNKEQFLPYLFWKKEIQNYTISYEGLNFVDYYLPLTRYFGVIDIFNLITLNYLKSTENYRVAGFRAMDSEWNDDFQIAKSKMESYKAKIDPASKKLFERFIHECDSLDIQLILAYTPEYIDGQNFISNRSEIVEMFSNYARENDLIFLDYSSDSICLDKSNFYNSTHLNRRGATKFTKKLARDLKNLGIE